MASLSGVIQTSGAGSEPKNTAPVLKSEVKSAVRSIADQQPVFMDILQPEMVVPEGKRVPISSIPSKEKTKALGWIRKMLKKEWLPENMEDILVGKKDMKQWEKRDKKGIVFSEIIGDFIVGEYEIQGHRFHIQESGVSISIRVDLLRSVDISQNAEAFIKQSLNRFVNFPAGVQIAAHLQERGPLCYGKLQAKGGEANKVHWWKDVTVCTDGNFFFISCPQVNEDETSVFNPQAQPGLPDRF